MLTVYEKGSALPLTKSEVEALVEKNGKWEGQSVEFRMCSFHFYTIEKNDGKYSVQVTDGSWIKKSSDWDSFHMAYLSLEYLDTALHNMRVSLNSHEPLGASLIDTRTNKEVFFENIRSRLLTEGVWDGYVEWKPNVRSMVTFLRDERNGYTLVVQFGSMNLSGRAIAKITDAFVLLSDFNNLVSSMIK